MTGTANSVPYPKNNMRVLVTTGATIGFDGLIAGVLNATVIESLVDAGFTEVIVQYGHSGDAFNERAKQARIKVNGFPFSDDIRGQIRDADLVISHAGTGSIIDALREKKKLVVVPNTLLMDDHQQEIAREFERLNYLVLSNSMSENDIAKSIRQCMNGDLTELPPAASDRVASIIDQEAGFMS